MINYDILRKLQLKYRLRVLGSELSSFKSGGIIPLVFFPASVEEAVKAFEFLADSKGKESSLSAASNAKKSGKFAVLGAGTNTLILDEGYGGVVVCMRGVSFKRILDKDGLVEAGAGESLISLSNFAAAHSFSGLEFACGIPGSVGGAVFMNAGAYDGNIEGVLEYVDVYDFESRRVNRLTKEQAGFEYRSSRFQRAQGIKEVILKAAFRLKKGEQLEIKKTVAELNVKRLASQATEPSLGSVFKRNGKIIPSALIDKAGLKGYNIGRAAVSKKHAGFIINTGGATSADYLNLVRAVKDKLRELYGVEILEEFKVLE